MQSFANNPALKSHLETQVNFLTELSQKAFDSVRKLTELNMHLSRQLMDDWINLNRAVLQCPDQFQMTAAAMNQLQPVAEHLRSYQQQLMGLLASAQIDLARSAETYVPETTRSARAMADETVRHASATASAAANPGAAHNPT
jgi:phasin family protein